MHFGLRGLNWSVNILCIAEEDEEDTTAECERRSKRQREALIRLEADSSRDSDYDPSKHHRPKRQHYLSVNSLSSHHHHHRHSSPKCAKTLTETNPSQQRNRQLQFLRQVHSSHKRINDLKKASKEG